MADYRETLDDLEFARETAKMSPEALLRFTAQQAFKANRRITKVADLTEDNRKRIAKIESRQAKVLGVVSGAGILLGAVITALWNWIIHR